MRGRFEFEPSLHELSGIGTPEDPGSVELFFRRLGADVELNWGRSELSGDNAGGVALTGYEKLTGDAKNHGDTD